MACRLRRGSGPLHTAAVPGPPSSGGRARSVTPSGGAAPPRPPPTPGAAPLREAAFIAAKPARRTDPTLAARYHRLMVAQGKHHNSALCHISMALLTRIIA